MLRVIVSMFWFSVLRMWWCRHPPVPSVSMTTKRMQRMWQTCLKKQKKQGSRSLLRTLWGLELNPQKTVTFWLAVMAVKGNYIQARL